MTIGTAFYPLLTGSLSVSSTSSQFTLDTPGASLLRIANAGPDVAFFTYGVGDQVAETTGDTPILPGTDIIVSIDSSATFTLAAICDVGDTALLYLTGGLEQYFEAAPTIADTYGPRTFTINSITNPPYTHGSGTLGVSFAPSVAFGGSATCNAYWSTTAPTSEPTANGTTILDVATMSGSVGPLFSSGNLDCYAALPPTEGTWYLSFWITNDGSNDGGVVLSPVTVD